MNDELFQCGPPLDGTFRVVIEHKGGPLDGLRIASDSGNPIEAKLAIGTYLMSENGKVGKAKRTIGPVLLALLGIKGLRTLFGVFFAMRRARKSGNMQRYEVVDTEVGQGEVIVFYEHKETPSEFTN